MPLNDNLIDVTPGHVDQAYARISPFIRRTPLCSSPLLNRRIGCDLQVKAEVLQYSGSFKFRGASNRLRALRVEQPECNHVVAYSSGNHGQAIAAVASQLGLSATIIMPKDAPKIKIDRTRAFGAEIVLYDRDRDNREAMGREIADKTKGCIAPPYDDPYVIAGQGTIGLEIVADMESGADVVIIPAGGGGLSAGTGLTIKRAWPNCKIYVAEPEGFNDHHLSLQAGERRSIAKTIDSICDAIKTPIPGNMTFPINLKQLSGSLLVSDLDVLKAIKTGIEEFKLVIEPGGVVALAAALKYADQFRGKKMVAIASGGNVDMEIIGRALSA